MPGIYKTYIYSLWSLIGQTNFYATFVPSDQLTEMRNFVKSPQSVSSRSSPVIFTCEIPENRSFIKLLHPTDSIISRIQKPVEINIITAYTCSSPIHASIRVKHSRSMIDTARRARERHGWLRQTATVTNASVLVRCVGPLMKLAAVESVEMRSLGEREKERNRLVCRPEVWDSAGKKRRRERLENLRAPFVTLAESISRLAER